MNIFKKDLRGLSNFISDIRNCKSKEEEIKRINDELGKIRSKLGGTKILNETQKRKYVCKLTYIFLLGYNTDLGHLEAVNLLHSNKYNDKSIGYLFASVVIDEKSNLMKLIRSSVQHDFASLNPPHQNLALQYLANTAHLELAVAFHEDVMNILFKNNSSDPIRQSALLCLLSFYRVNPTLIPSSEENLRKIVCHLDDDNLGVVTAAISLIEFLVEKGKVEEMGLQLALSRLNRTLKSINVQGYNYKGVPGPWLTVKLLKLLAKFRIPNGSILEQRLEDCIAYIFQKAGEPSKSRKVDYMYTKNAVTFEAINLVYNIEISPSLQVQACEVLEVSLQQKDSNLRFLALEAMQNLCFFTVCREKIKNHLKTIENALNNERDPVIQKKALGLLFFLCEKNNSENVVSHLFNQFESNAYIRTEISWNVAIIAENYYSDPLWYVDVMFKLLNVAGDYCTDHAWFRAIPIIAKDHSVRGYAAVKAFEVLQLPLCNDKVKALAAYILGEYGNLIAGDPRSSPLIQLKLLQSKYASCPPDIQVLFLNCYVKFLNLFPEIKIELMEIFKSHSKSENIEIQKRAVEYLKLCHISNRDTLAVILDEMPYFEMKSENKEQKITEETHKKPISMKAECDSDVTLSSSLSYISLSDLSLHQEPQYNRLVSTPSQNFISDSQFDLLADSLDSENNEEIDIDKSVVKPLYEKFPHQLIWNEIGILYENNILLIIVQSAFCEQKGSLFLRYNNKTHQPVSNFEQRFFFESFQCKVGFQVSSCPSIIRPLEELEQCIQVVCLQEFSQPPSLSLQFCWNDVSYSVPLAIPLTLNKFVKPFKMDNRSFFARWEKMTHRFHDSFRSVNPQMIDSNSISVRLTGLNVAILEGVDPNPDNFIGVGIFQSLSSHVGFMFRLQVLRHEGKYLLDIRGSVESTIKEMARLMEIIL